MIVASTIASCRSELNQWRQAGLSIALVPTMGYFHEGHLALMRKGRELCDRVVASLFVNPTQFGPHEDLAVYPSDYDGDCRKADQTGVNLLFSPKTDLMYQQAHQTTVQVHELTKGLCGKDRPGHFQGVTTVVAKLFNIIQPDFAIFGEKDFQQLVVIRRMVADLDFPVKIIGHPIVREKDGLAMSSRNVYLTPEERRSACILSKTMHVTRDAVLAAADHLSVSALLSQAKTLISGEKNCSLEYFTIVDEHSLTPCDVVKGKCRAMGALRVNERIRLIDNMPLY